MAQIVHLNGPPGIGKSTLSALWADRHPGTLNLDVDLLHRLVGGWQDEEIDNWPAVWSLTEAMATTHLHNGHDVVLPQYIADPNKIAGLEKLAGSQYARFREVVLQADRETAIDRFNRRGSESEDPWIRHHHRLITHRGGATMLGSMYDDLTQVMRSRPDAVTVPSTTINETYARLVHALS